MANETAKVHEARHPGQPRRVPESVFVSAAATAVLAAVFHAAAMASPAIAQIGYSPDYPSWRHVMFIAINSLLAALFIRRPRWLIWPYTLLTLHVFNGHGLGAWRLWLEEGRVDWISVAVTTGAPVILVALWLERRRAAGL